MYDPVLDGLSIYASEEALREQAERAAKDVGPVSYTVE